MLKVKQDGREKAQLMLDSSSESGSDSEEASFQKTSQKKGKDKSKKGSDGELSINKNYAERYDNWRNLEEMQKLKNRLGISDISELNDENDSSSESSSEEEQEWSPENEKAFLKTLACLKTKNPKIYSDEFGFFKSVEDGSNEEAVGSKKKKEDKKPFTVRDHERRMVLEKASQASDDEEEEEEDGGNEKSYPEELASIKTAFSKALNQIDSSDDEDGDGLVGNNLLKRRTNKSSEEKEREEEEYKLWLKGELEKLDKGKLPKEDKKELKALRDYWNDDKLDEGEKFLRDYILNKKYIDPTKGDKDYIPSYNEVVHDDDELSNDEKFEAEREEFEHKYNFRFEEPDQEFIKRYPRTIKESMRREETKRKEQREKAKERKEELKARKKEEVQRLKALKRKEIMDKIQKLHAITGDPDLDLSEVDIDGDFDPKEYDRRMQQLFNDNYYQQGADEEKPVFEYDEEIDGEEENYEDWVPTREDNVKSEEESEGSTEESEDGSDPKEEVSEFFGRQSKRAATQQELIEASKGKRGRKKRSAFLEVLEREKPKFDPKLHKSFEQYFEEYYKLDFEDIIGEDVKCRFKYHKTVPNDFGLTTEEILKAEDRELNQWASLKKTYQYRGEDEEVYEIQAYKKKAEKPDLKKRLLPSIYQPAPEKPADESDGEADNEKQKKKKKKKNKKKNKDLDISVKEEVEEETKSVKVKKEKKKDFKSVADTECAKSDAVGKTESSGASLSPQSEKSRKRTSPTQSSESTHKSPETPKLSKRQRKNRKKHLGESQNGDSSAAAITPSPVKSATQNEKANKSKNKNKDNRGRKRKMSNLNETNGVPIDEDRLRSYGLNPKKFKKQMKYGNSAAKMQ